MKAWTLLARLGIGPLLLGLANVRGASDLPAKPLDLPGIENVYRLSPQLYSGGEPRGEAAFAALKALGVKSVISVDGAAPDVESARKSGIRYVHLPIGYDGVPRDQAIRLIKAAQTLPGPVFIHCHHGKHRGPAAAAVCGMAMEGWSREQAVSWMRQAGTAAEYRGLYESIRRYVPPTPSELDQAGNEFPERARVPALVETMVQVDGTWDRLKAIRAAGFRAPPGQPDVDPPHEALQLRELLREASRLEEVRVKGPDLIGGFQRAGARAEGLRRALQDLSDRPGDHSLQAAAVAFDAVSRTCTGCHARHRDNETGVPNSYLPK